MASLHDLLVRKDGTPTPTAGKDLKDGDKIITTSDDTQILKVEPYTLERKVAILTEPVGFLLTEKGVLLPSLDEPLPGEDRYVNLHDVIQIAHAWAPVVEEMHEKHPCLFEHLATNDHEVGHAVIVQFFEDFLQQHPHESGELIAQPQEFLDHVRTHHDAFTAHALEFCNGDI